MNSKRFSLAPLALTGAILQVGVAWGNEDPAGIAPPNLPSPAAQTNSVNQSPFGIGSELMHSPLSPGVSGKKDSDGDGLSDEYEVGHGRYAAIKGDFNWLGAVSDATRRGGHVATITSEEEWKALKEVLGTIPHGYYLGGTDEKTEGIWEWITGETWAFTKWASGEPNNLPRTQYGDEDFAQTWTATSEGNRLWNDIYGKKNPWSKGYILEYGYYTDPTHADSDGDGVGDGIEVVADTDPNNALSRPDPEGDAPHVFPGENPVPFQEKVDQIEKETVALRGELKTSEATVEQLRAKLTTREDRIATLENELAKAIAQIEILQNRLDERDIRIADLESEIIQRRHSQQEADEKVEELNRIAEVPFVNGWVYLPEQGWLWTDAQTYPYVYRSETKSWCYFQQGTLPRLFFDDTSKEWEAWDVYEEYIDQIASHGENFK